MTHLAKKKLALKPNQLRWHCPQRLFSAKDSSKIPPLTEIIGQDRALSAIKLGLAIKSPGYNIFVTGMTGTGRKSTIKQLLEQLDSRAPIPGDICYVFNFRDPDAPAVLYVPAGKGKELAADIMQVVRDLQQAVPLIFESEHFRISLKQLMAKVGEKTRTLIGGFEDRVRESGFAIVNVEMGGGEPHPQLFPVLDGNVVNWEEMYNQARQGKLDEEELQRRLQLHAELSEELQQKLAAVRQLNRESERQARALRIKAIEPYVGVIIADLKKRYPDARVVDFLDALKADVLENFELFLRQDPGDAKASAAPSVDGGPDPFLRYRVNVLVDNSSLRRPPVIIENFPTYKNLFGTIERVVEKSGVWRTDFTRIRAGSLLRANGGYLVLNLSDTLIEPGVWTSLKRALKYGQVDIQAQDPFFLANTSNMHPEPISVNVKVIIVGEAYAYNRMAFYDEDFRKIFKIRADFDHQMPRDEQAIRQYAAFISRLSADEGLLPFDRSGMAAVVEYGVWLTSDKQKLSTKFSLIADLLREADYYARAENATHVQVAHVDNAVEGQRYRNNLFEQRLQENIERGRYLIDTEGAKIGQINGLTVYRYGDYSFGRPSRITCQVGTGSSGVMSIDREADLSGKTHRKGIAIISGYLRGMYAAHRNVNMSVSLTFEQSYGPIDGDSASSAEIYTILSALAEVPVRQDLAVTGSVSQRGEIQPIGAVNEKIEGFFDACKGKGLTGTQGVIIPKKNVVDLMLRKDVVEAVRRGKFHLYAIETIDEGIELLTGIAAGKRDARGNFPPESIHGRVERRLQELSESGKSQKQNDKANNKKNAHSNTKSKQEAGAS